jgi:DNA-binding CsgD family transcriptional regulator
VIADLEGDTEQARVLLEQTAQRGPAVMAGAAFAYRARIGLLAHDRDAARADLRAALTQIAPQRALYPLARIAAGTPGYFALLEDEITDADPHPFALSALNGCVRYRRPFADQTFLPIAPAPRPTGARPAAGLLTPRETDVLRELALGSSYADIAAALYISENTVKTHVVSLYRKLGADRRATALRQARALGLI